MRLGRAKRILVTAAAMLSLVVSAVAACACSHHQPVKSEVRSSCHGPSHQAPAVEQSNISTTHFESDCSCLVRTQVPAIVAKKDEKRASVEQQVAEPLELSGTIAVELAAADEPESAFDSPVSNYRHALLASLPSRAPPRL